ncbi:MAG: AMP-binding protein [Halioglobus sp.]|nr:AMP-binding protein [Halioglobus sp.]
MSSFYAMAQKARSKKAFLQTDNRHLTYGGLVEQLGKLNRFIDTAPLSSGDRVVIGCDDDEFKAVLFFALVDNGMVPIIVSSEIRASEFELIAATTGVAGCIMDAGILQRCCPDARDLKLRLEIRKREKQSSFMNKLLGSKKQGDGQAMHFPALLDSLETRGAPESWPPGHIAYISMTSGSTSNPKAVPVTHGALHAHLKTLSVHFRYSAESSLLNILPLHHADGLVQGPLVACFNAGTWVRPFAFSIQNIEPLLLSFYRHRVTHAVFVPTILALLYRYGATLLDSFEYEEFDFLISAAGYLEEALWHDFESTFGIRIANIYGLTETVTGALFCGPDEETRRLGSIGKPVDCEAIIRAEDGSQTDGVGELLLRGDNVFPGYIGRKGVNDDVFRDGWLRTGDLAHRDEDGFFYIDGRIKNVVICGGENIYPEEITEVLGQYPNVIEAACLGIEHPEWGEILVAALVVDGDYVEEKLVSWCEQQLSHFKVPKEWMVIDSMPRGPSGKVLLPALRKAFAGRAAVTSGTGSTDLLSKVIAIAASVFHVAVSDLGPQSSPENTSGWDSLAHVNFILALESGLGIQLATREIMGISSLQTAFDIVAQKIR